MPKRQSTKERLLDQGRRLFWSRGYSQVSLREIAQAADADVALISRYFGGKMQLFEATLDLVDRIDHREFADAEALVDGLVALCVEAPRQADMPSPLSLVLVNAGDAEVGDRVRDAYCRKWLTPIAHLTDPTRAALLTAAIVGMGVVEKALRLPGIAEPASPDYAAQLRALIAAALGYTAPEPSNPGAGDSPRSVPAVQSSNEG